MKAAPQVRPAPLVQVRTVLDVQRELWRELHTHAASLADIDLLAELDWLVRWSTRVPCGTCRQHWQELWDANPADLSSPAAYFAWTVGLHNAVNARLDKPLVTVEDARAMYPATTTLSLAA